MPPGPADTVHTASPDRWAGALPGAGRRIAHWVTLIAGAVALVGAALLPLLPVTVNQPTITWPRDARAPESTALLLTAYQPRAIDVRFSCQTARLADLTGDDLVLSTVQPAQIGAPDFGLLVTASGGRVEVRSAGALLLDERVPSGSCHYRVQGGAEGLIVTRDGARVGDDRPAPLPEVEALVTGLTGMPAAGPGDLAVRVEVNDQFSTSPTPGKLVVIGLVVLALAASTLGAGRLDWGVARGRLGRVSWWPGPADLAVLATLVAWLFLAPTTDDDGYYGAMAENVPLEGYVANYYQLYNQSFTPFTWVYVALSKWQLLGESPVVLRVPALVCGLLTWLLLSRFVAACHARAGRGGFLPARLGGRGGAMVLQGVLAATFLGWWMPQNMGFRPEAVVALFAAGALVAVLAAVERRSLLLAAVAVGLGSLGFTAHPTGVIALAPLVAAAPALWPLIRGRSLLATAARLMCVLAPVAVAALAGFADGSLRDFTRSQEIFLSVQDQDSWYDEYIRYGFLLGESAMGNYAKRAAVLLALVGLVWFTVLIAAARARRVAVPPRLAISGWALAVALLLLWLTPSKPSHHFGALAGIGPAWLALLLLFAPVLVVTVTDGRGVPRPVLVAVVGSMVLAMALAGHGLNLWPFYWMTGLADVAEPPDIMGVELDQPLWWLLAVVLVAGLTALWATWRAPHWRRHAPLVAVPLVIVAFFVTTLGYLVGSFGAAAARTWGTYSLQAANLQDPLATGCPTSNAVQVLDERTGRSLPMIAPAPRPPAEAGFAEGFGWHTPSGPPVAPGTAAATDIWGSLVRPPDSDDADENLARWATPWYRMPELAQRQALATLVSGRVGGPNSLTIEFGRTTLLGIPQVIESRPVDHAIFPGLPVDSAAWRGTVLAEPGTAPPGTDAIRLIAEDGATDLGGWLAFTAPTVQRYVTLREYLPESDPIAVSWQFAFLFPCLRQPRQQDGVTEAPTHSVLWGEGPLGGLDDPLTMQKYRGGSFARAPLLKTVYQPVSRLRDFPEVTMIEVYRYTSPLASAAYTLTRDRTVVPGW